MYFPFFVNAHFFAEELMYPVTIVTVDDKNLAGEYAFK